MFRIGCPHEFIIRCIHQIPDFFNLAGHLINKLLRLYPGSFGFVLDLLSVFIRSSLKEYVISQHSLIAGNAVGQHDFIGIADVRLA